MFVASLLANIARESLLQVRPHQSARGRNLFEHVDVAGGAHVFQDLRPDANADLAQVRLAQQQHECAGLADAAADAEGELIVQNRLMIRVL